MNSRSCTIHYKQKYEYQIFCSSIENDKSNGKICPNMAVWIKNFQKFMCNSSRDIICYFSTVTSEDLVRTKLCFRQPCIFISLEVLAI